MTETTNQIETITATEENLTEALEHINYETGLIEAPEDGSEAEGYGADRFAIDNDDVADWAIRKIQEGTADYNRLKELADRQIAQIQEKVERERQKAERSIGFLKSCLAGYFGTVEHKKTKTQETYKLLSGTLVLKKGGQTQKYDDDALLDYLAAEGLDEYIKTTTKPAWGEFKKLLVFENGAAVNKETGEVIPCITVEDKPDTFDIKA